MLSGRDFIQREDWAKRNIMKFSKKCKVRGTLPFTSAAWEPTEEQLLCKGPRWAMGAKLKINQQGVFIMTKTSLMSFII